MPIKKCTVCSRQFTKTEHWKRHERSHTKERPYECVVCQKRFSRSDVLSRHAKGHNQGTKPQDVAKNQSDASTPTPSLPTTGPLDLLANLSAQHSRAEPNIHPMLLDESQPYFGWNEVTPAAVEPVTQRNGADMLQLWLEPQTEIASNHGSLDLGNFSFDDNMTMSTDPHRPSVDSKSGSDNIPTERFSRVQRYWPVPNQTERLMNGLWKDIVQTRSENLFAKDTHSILNDAHLLQGSRYGIDDDCRRRLQASFAQEELFYPQTHAVSPATSAAFAYSFPPAEILDMALDLFFRTFHPLVPCVHLPTFDAKKTHLPHLYVMCLFGMMLMGTKGTTTYVLKNFAHTQQRIASELERCTVYVESPANVISTFSTTFLFLNLAVLTGEKSHLEQSQMLYVNLISAAQRHGLFEASQGQILDMSLFEAVPDVETRWKAWSKVESAKRVIISLLLLDSWFSSLLATTPIISPESIQIIMPCNEALFNAPSSIRWTQLIREGKRIIMSTVPAPSELSKIPALEDPMHEFGMQAILAMIQLRQSEAYYRLLSDRAHWPFAPCHTYAMDGRARCLPSLQSQIATEYSDVLQQLNPNALIMWHHMCMGMTADHQIFDLAAGRGGPQPARKALQDIAEWSKTPAARRSCLHAVHIYKAMTNRRASDHPTFHSVFALFSAALVLGLYTFMVPEPQVMPPGTGSIELMDDVDWKEVGLEGFTSFMEPRGSQSSSLPNDPTINFIRNGSIMFLRGVPFHGGYQSARRILLDYANLLKDSGKRWTVKKFSYILHIMSDVLMEETSHM